MVDHREGVIASSEQQFATHHCPRHIQIDLFLGLTETVALISNRFNGLAQITPGLNQLGPVGGVCSSLLLCAVEINPKVAGNIEAVAAGQNELSIVLSIAYKNNEYSSI